MATTPSTELDLIDEAEYTLERMEQTLAPLLSAIPLPAEARAQHEAMFRLLKLAPFYMRETKKCFAGEAYFAANVLGAAALETLLLSMCLMNQQQVRKTNKWQQLQRRKPKPFLTQMGNMDLATLLDIGSELGWFSKREVPQMFREMLEQHFGAEITEMVCQCVPRGGELSADTSRDARNKLHPAKCLREPFQLSQTTGMYASLCLILALASFAEKQWGQQQE